MRIAIDQLDILHHLIDEGFPLTNILGLQVFVLESELTALPKVSRLILSPIKKHGIINFIDLNEIFFSEVLALRKKFGAGISMQNYCILQYCRNSGLIIVSSDGAIIRLAKAIGIPFRTPDTLKFDLLIGSSFANKRVGKQAVEKSKETIMIKTGKK